MNFASDLKDTITNEYNFSTTENGAVGYKTTKSALVDINFAIASLRGATGKEITTRFMAAYYENKTLAMKWLFFARDVREGLGERSLFRTIMAYLTYNHPDVASSVLALIPMYGRYDDLVSLINTPLSKEVINIIKAQLAVDNENYKNGNPISLLAKWLPSANASSPITKNLAKRVIIGLGMIEKTYRKMLSALRKYLNVVEVDMSAKSWDNIDYEAVPSKANLLYNGAFLRNDETRRRAFLDSLSTDEAKINSSVLFPYDIVNSYDIDSYSYKTPINETLEALWKSLPNLVKTEENIIVVADGSGSMLSNVSKGSSVTALDIANSLAIYFSERASGQFKDKYITFSSRPQFVDLSGANTLKEKIRIARSHNEADNTNIEAVFRMILKTAVDNKCKQEEIPSTILIISDMEFDACTVSSTTQKRLFQQLNEIFNANEYKLPKLVFWNVNSRTGTIPVIENENGVGLVSGFSVNIVNMVLSSQLNPYDCLIEQLNKERYMSVEVACRAVLDRS